VIRRILPAVVIVIAAVVTYMSLSSVYFLSGIAPESVRSITVEDSGTDTTFTVDDPGSIARIVNTVQGTRTHRKGFCFSPAEFRYRMTFYGENGAVLESYDLNAINAINRPPFYYETPFEGYISIERDDPLCFNYLGMLANMNDSVAFRGTGIAMAGSGIVVEPEEGSAERGMAGQISIAGKYLPSAPEPAVGDTVEVMYNGELNPDTDPAKPGEIYSVSVVKRAAN